MHDIASKSSTSRNKGASLYDKYLHVAHERLNQILTPEQQQSWQKMVGQPFSFPPPSDGFKK